MERVVCPGPTWTEGRKERRAVRRDLEEGGSRGDGLANLAGGGHLRERLAFPTPGGKKRKKVKPCTELRSTSVGKARGHLSAPTRGGKLRGSPGGRGEGRAGTSSFSPWAPDARRPLERKGSS